MNALLLRRELGLAKHAQNQQEEQTSNETVSVTTTTTTTPPVFFKKIRIDSQLELNHLVHKLMTSSSPGTTAQQQLLHIQVIQKRDRPHLSITGLLKAFLLLPQQQQQPLLVLHSLSLPNVAIGAAEAKLLASLLKQQQQNESYSPPASSLRSLQLGQLEVTVGVPILLAAVGASQSLHELHLRLRVANNQDDNGNARNLATNLAHDVCRALQQSDSLQRISLSGFALLNHDSNLQQLLAQTVTSNPQWTELRLQACNLVPVVSQQDDDDLWNHQQHQTGVVVTDLQALAHAVATHPNLQRVDLMHNDLCDPAALVTLLSSSSNNQIRHLCLSQNWFGADCHETNNNNAALLGDALRDNTVLQELWIDGNPVTEAFAQNILLRALQYVNTTLRTCVVRPNHIHDNSNKDNNNNNNNKDNNNNNNTVSSTMVEQIRHFAALNAAGRGAWRRLLLEDNHHHGNIGDLLAEQPSVDTTYGLLREDPGRWVRLLLPSCRPP